MTQSLGALGEDRVAQHLQSQGFLIVARNFRLRGGEIDIIATKSKLLIFVEVKARSLKTDNLSEVVTYSKQLKIIHTAQYFLAHSTKKYSLSDCIYRFDVALINGNDAPITYIPNAFTSAD